MELKRPHGVAFATVGAGALIEHRGQICLVQLNYGQFKGAWILPGGLVDPGETPLQAAEREVLEETGLTVVARELLAVRHRVAKEAQVDPGGARSGPKHCDDYWVFRADLTGLEPGAEFPKLVWPAEELIEARFWPKAELLASSEVRPLTRMFVELADQPERQGRGFRQLQGPAFPGSDEFFVYA